MFILTGLVTTTFLLSIYCLYAYMKSKGQKYQWWKWVLTILWLFVTYFTFGFIGTSIGEGYSQAALRGGAFFMAFVVVGGALIFRFFLYKGAKAK